MGKLMGIMAVLCTILFATMLNGSLEMIVNTTSIVIVLGVYFSSIILLGFKLDDIRRFREITTKAAMLAVILSVVINGLSLMYSYTNLNSFGKPIQGILVTLLYVSTIQFVIHVSLFKQEQ